MNSEKPIFILLSIKIFIIIIISFIIGMFFANDIYAYGKGLALGGIFTILKLKLMEVTISKAVVKDPKAAQSYASIHYALRYILTILVLVVAALEPSINLIGVIIGVLSLKIAAFWQGQNEKPTPKDGSVEFLEWEEDEKESDF